MQQSVNFYELKTQLADLGFNEPALIDQLREAVVTQDTDATLDTEIEDTWFQFHLQKNGTGDFEIKSYDAVFEKTWASRYQLFEPTVTAREAMLLLEERMDFPEVTDEISYTPMSRETARLNIDLDGDANWRFADIVHALIQLKAIGLYENDVGKQLEDLPEKEIWRKDVLVEKDGLPVKLLLDIDEDQEIYLKGYELQGCAFPANLPIDIPLKQINNPGGLKHLAHKFSNPMNTQNLSYLQKQLLNLGFGEGLNADLEKHITAKTPEFTLNATQEYNKQNVDYALHYKAGDKDEMYFFNKYDASLQGKDRTQTFYLNKGSGITAKEAYNLMEGRAVHKQLENLEGEKYHAWLILDKENKTENGNFKLRPFTENWNYKPERAIDKLDIVGIGEEGAREKLMKSLEKGNRHQVTAMKDGKEVKLFLEANPAEHRVNLTNWKGEAQQLEHYKKPELKTEQKKAETQKQETSKKKSKGHKMSM